MSFLDALGDMVHRITGVRKIPDRLAHPGGATTLDIDGFSQLDDHSCGAVAGWCVVRSFDRRRTNFDRFRAMCRTTENGTTSAPLVRALKAHGLCVQHVRREISFEKLAAWIDDGYPVICVVDHDRRDKDAHWMVVYGYRRRPAQVLAAGNGWMHVFGVSLKGQHEIPRRLFERQFEHEALVCWKENRAGERVGLPFRRAEAR